MPAYRLWLLRRSTTYIHVGEAGIQGCALEMHRVIPKKYWHLNHPNNCISSSVAYSDKSGLLTVGQRTNKNNEPDREGLHSMAIERWGSLSVADHNDTTALTANVLLYDRLVMPIYTEAHDRDEREYWDQKGWNPDLQNQRREQLGDLIIECAWDETRRQSYTERYQAAAQISDEINGEMITRWLLTENHDEYPLLKGVSHADVFLTISAYPRIGCCSSFKSKMDISLLSGKTNGENKKIM